MLEFDEQLRPLALTAQKHPPLSKERQKALNQLISVLQQSGGLCSPNRTYGAQYPEVKDEGRSRLFKYICENIDKYNADKGEVLQWANFLLKMRFYIEAYRDLNTEGQSRPPRLSLDDLDNLPNPQIRIEPPEESMSQELRRLLEEDPENVFKTAHVQSHPKASFQFIALQKINGYAWDEISQQLHNIPVPTLSSFYQRSLKKFIPFFRDYLS